jgi:hypothetical protein
MAQAMEFELVGKPEFWTDVVSNVESDATPLTSLLDKRKRPLEVLANWQVQGYKRKGHRGVRDGQDANNFGYNGRERLKGVTQKAWDPRGVSDFSEEVDVKGIPSGELAAQMTDAMVTIKQIVERRLSSNEESAVQDEDDPNGANETRGFFKWLDTAAQTHEPVPEKFRPLAAQLYTGTLANFTESVLENLVIAAWKRRLGNSVSVKFFLGIELDKQISDFTVRDSGFTGGVLPVRTFMQDGESKQVIKVVKRLVFSAGTVDLIPTAHLMTDAATGEDTDYTHKSGMGLDMDKVGVAWMRLPRVYKLAYQGGGYKAVADAMFMGQFDNPVGCFSARINS